MPSYEERLHEPKIGADPHKYRLCDDMRGSEKIW